jgi:hypothetical protein
MCQWANYSWLTVVSKEEPDGVEVVLEPMGFAPAKVYQKALKDAGIPVNYVSCRQCSKAEFERLKKLGVKFSMKPTQMGPTTLAVFDDTCWKQYPVNSGVKFLYCIYYDNQEATCPVTFLNTSRKAFVSA